MTWKLLQHVAQVTPRLDAQALAGGREAEQHCCRLAAAGRPYTQPVFPADGYPFHLALGRVVHDLNALHTIPRILAFSSPTPFTLFGASVCPSSIAESALPPSGCYCNSRTDLSSVSPSNGPS